MKKIYLEPTTQVVILKTSHMLAYSDPVTGTNVDPTKNTPTMDARRSDFDFEDFDEEY